ncbi:MAG: SIMPL domain-containing protein [Candidatus Pacebacteria bacterium]|nr:SIMPL domain-containing protein [Candidatus Paceibacterota bacterium]MBT4004652.1 SIMPL domain-containing protein [Candidatus Paceibacterota bacterium]MBT4358430.1 SIMPL domain-containing protein [Candidatus Paceibacterota bacterium]MBT4681050.1 SIMPL domain-containing protein [Candidatus Paceibacterota bacterium]MBT6899359.1 SIMPL domain-containing protein [Candidatus Paceibacterota bacterium]
MNQEITPQVANIQDNFMQTLTNFFNQYKKIILTTLVVIGSLFLVKAIFFKPAVISVVGTGSLTAKPDQVEMLVTKVDSNPDPVLAIMAGEESIVGIVAKAKELAGNDVEIQKSFYQVTPSVVTGDVLYQVINVFKITAQDPSKATDLIKGFYASGATTVSGVNFIPENREEITQDARKAAVKDAKKQARDIAKASGKRVGRIISVGDDLSKGNSTVSTNGLAQAEAEAQASYTGGSPVEIDVSKSMTVTYEIW